MILIYVAMRSMEATIETVKHREIALAILP